MIRSREHNEANGEAYYYESIGLSKGPGDPDSFPIPGMPEDTEPVETPEAF